MTRRGSSRALAALAVLGALLGLVPTARAADERSPAAIIQILGRVPENREAAYDDSLKAATPAPRPLFGVAQPDGSYKYGNVSVYVKETCPESANFEPPPLPGRRRLH
jgi:hypothetical protein